MSVMSADDEAGKAARTFMGEASGTDLAGYEAQLASTRMFYSAADAVAFTNSDGNSRQTMQAVAEFSFDHGLLGEGAPDASFIGIETPAGVFGNDGQHQADLRPDLHAARRGRPAVDPGPETARAGPGASHQSRAVRPAADRVLALAPFRRALCVVYLLASEARLAENPDDKLLPSFATMADAVQRMAFEPSRRTGEYLLWADTAASLTRLALGVAISAAVGLMFGLAGGRPAAGARDAVAAVHRDLPRAAASRAAGTVHRLRTRRGVQGGADRDRDHADHHPRPRTPNARATPRAARQGADARRLDLADHRSHRAAAVVAAAHRGHTARPGCRVAVPDRRRGSRLYRRARLPHLPRAPLPLDGRDPALRRMDHAARLRARLATAPS